MRNCLFCEVILTKKNRAKEHVIPKWVVRKLKKEGVNFLSQTLSYPNLPPEVLSERSCNIDAHIFGNVCAKCNNGWMSSLEVETIPLLVTLWKPSKENKLTYDQCHTLAKWAFKTAAVINYSSDYKKIIPLQQIHEFYSKQLLPANSTVDVAYCGNCRNSIQSLQGGNKRFAIKNSSINNPELANSYMITIHLYHVMLRLAWTPVVGVLALAIPSHAVFRVHPPKKEDISIQVQGKIFRDHFQFYFVGTTFSDTTPLGFLD